MLTIKFNSSVTKSYISANLMPLIHLHSNDYDTLITALFLCE